MLFKAGTKLKAHKTTIALVGGIAALTGAVVLSVKGGMEITPILDERKERVNECKKKHKDYKKSKAKAKKAKETNEEIVEEVDVEVYTEDDMHDDIAEVNKEAFMEVSKKVLLPVALTGAAITLFVYAHVEEKKHSALLAGALASTQTAFNAYRDRVRTYLGDEKEQQVYQGMRKKKVVDENGTEVTKEVYDNDERQLGLKSIDRCFDESNPNWVDGADWNRDFLFKVQNELQRLLEDRCEKGFGIVFLNEAYEALGYDKTADGNILGWYYEYGNDPEHNHKGVIDFGLGCPDTACRLFMNGYEKNVWLRFNVDGDMLALLRTRGKSFR
jgi:hypothetical protein